MYRKTISIMAIIMLLSCLISIYQNFTFHFIIWVNTLFVISLITLILGAILQIIQSRVFTHEVQNFKRFFYNLSKTRQVADEVEQKKDKIERPKQYKKQRKSSFILPLIISSFTLFMLAIVLSLLV